jgi:hypothetical protein
VAEWQSGKVAEWRRVGEGGWRMAEGGKLKAKSSKLRSEKRCTAEFAEGAELDDWL